MIPITEIQCTLVRGACPEISMCTLLHWSPGWIRTKAEVLVLEKLKP